MWIALARGCLGMVAFGLCACSSAAAGSPESEDAGGPADGGAATFTEVYAQIITGAPACSGCHAPPSPTGELDMSTKATAYANLVGKPATSAPLCASATQLLVDPGSAAGSLLYLKVTNPPCGSQMPLQGTPLSSAQTGLIASWINAGAKDD